MVPAFIEWLTEGAHIRETEHSKREMRGFCCVVLWIFPIFSSTIETSEYEYAVHL